MYLYRKYSRDRFGPIRQSPRKSSGYRFDGFITHTVQINQGLVNSLSMNLVGKGLVDQKDKGYHAKRGASDTTRAYHLLNVERLVCSLRFGHLHFQIAIFGLLLSFVPLSNAKSRN